MPRRRASPPGRGSRTAPGGCTVTVCRGCCCGTDRKHPGVDHAGQVAALVTGIGGAGRVRVTDCLDACERSNVVVVGPSPDGRRAGARPAWLANVLHPETVAEVVEWVRDGGPGIGEPPGLLDLCAFTPSRRARLELGDI